MSLHFFFVKTAKKNGEDQLAVYQEVCENFKPVFRHFFMERFPEPDQWYLKRLAYTRSAAVNSMGLCYQFLAVYILTSDFSWLCDGTG
jgi:hypothetical protein